MSNPRRKILLAILTLFILGILHSVYSEISWASNPSFGEAFVNELGYLGLSRQSECLSVRNPILEPICLPDIPGGYCYHDSCGMTSPVFIGKQYTSEVLKP